MGDKEDIKHKRDLFEDLELYGDTELIPLAMGAPGPSAISGCKDIMIEATVKTMVCINISIELIFF